MIYLDNNATTQPDHNMLNAVMEEAYQVYGNPSSQHDAGMNARDLLEDARAKVAKAINARPSEIIFTSGGTEANNIALKSTFDGASSGSVIGWKTEHSSVYKNQSYELDVDEGGIADTSPLRRAFHVDEGKTIVTCMMVNNETGVIQDPENTLFGLKEERGFLLHVDAVQAFGKLPIDVENTPIDMLTISAHKVHGLKGVGVLYVNRELQSKKLFRGGPLLIRPLMNGGPHELSRRPGTENFMGIRSLAYMVEKLASDDFYKARVARVEILRDRFENALFDVASPNGDVTHRVGNTTNLYFAGLRCTNEEFLDKLSVRGVYASAGSACSSGMQDAPSRVLTAMYPNNPERVTKSVRFSLSVNTTEEEIEKAARIIKECVAEGA